MEKKLYLGDCLKHLGEIPTESVNLIVTSPPYNADKEYEQRLSDRDYEYFIQSVFSEIDRVLKLDGRVCWVIAPTISRKGDELPFPLEHITMRAAENAGLLFWESIVWDQSHTEADTAWGSWQSASAPFIRHQTERVLLFVKATRKRVEKGESNHFKKEEFEKSTLDIWKITSETRTSKHPCPFPLDLALRCVKLFSYINDVVLDPFMGIGTTGEACKRLDRIFIGMEKEKKYYKIAKKKLITLDDYLEVISS